MAIMRALLLVAFLANPSFAGNEAAISAQMPTNGVVEVNGAELAYVREGRGFPLLVVGSATYYPKAFSDGLRQHFNLIFIDSRHFAAGYEPSNAQLGQLTLDTFVDDVEAVRQAVGVDQVAVLGHSVHAQIALAYAAKYPEHVTHLVLVAGLPFAQREFSEETDRYWDEHASPERKELLSRNLEHLEAQLAAAPSNRSFAVGYHARAPLQWADPAYDAREVLKGLENNASLGRLFGTVPQRAEVRQTLEAVSVPVLLTLGRLDFLIPHTVWEELIAGIDSITYVLLNDDSHNPQTEAPERFDIELIGWFRRN